jgi:hypothetical protein
VIGKVSKGHIYATDTLTYDEDTGATATAWQSFGNSADGSIGTGAAVDTYADSDSGSITSCDNVTTSWDSFNHSDSHSISGSESEWERGGGASVNINDTGARLRRIDGLTAYGTSTSYRLGCTA